MGIIMTELTLEYYINWFTNNHEIIDLNQRVNGIIVADLGADYLVLKDKVKEGIELEEKYYNIAKKRCSEYQSKLMVKE